MCDTEGDPDVLPTSGGDYGRVDAELKEHNKLCTQHRHRYLPAGLETYSRFFLKNNTKTTEGFFGRIKWPPRETQSSERSVLLPNAPIPC